VTGCRAVLMGDRRLFRDGLKEVLQKSRISVIGEARDIPDLCASLESRAEPDLVICHMASGQDPETALDLVYGLRRRFARAKLVVLADACNRSLLSRFVRADVDAILLTDISGETLQRSLELVLLDHRLFAAEVMSLITDSALAKPARNPAPTASVIVRAGAETALVDSPQVQAAAPNAAMSDPRSQLPLSRREHQIIDCLACGLPNKSIARELNIAEATVKVYVKGLLRKIKASNRTQVAIWALQQSHLFNADGSAGALEALGT
jgi:two-component system, NarL family, nitrate/nitrite response regulator NarL